MEEVVAESELVEDSQLLHQGPQLDPVAQLLQLLSGQLASSCELLVLGVRADIQQTPAGHLTLLLLHTRHQSGQNP